jgi:DNA-binding transcriptional regulator YhcF (GntR family)
MKPISQVIIAVAVAAGLTLGAAASGSAQGKPAPGTRVRNTPMGHPSNPSKGAAKPQDKLDTFRGVAGKLGTTPEAMQTAYETAKQANPKLTRGQFVAANILAKNLGSKNPAITTQALLSGLQGGKSIGQTLQSLGLSSKEAHDAQRQAARDAKEADRAEDAAEKPKP